MPKTFVFSTYGARGDVFPYLSIAHELKRRGQRALVATSENYHAQVEGLGIEFRAVAPDAPRGEDARKIMYPVSGTEWLFRRVLLPPLRQSVADLRAACENADVLITHTTSLAGPIVAELERNRGLKWVSSAVSPLALLGNEVVLPAVPGAAKFPTLNRAILALLKRQFGMNLKETQKIRAELGISRGDNALWSDAHAPNLQLALWSEKFAPIAPDSPRKAVGFCFLDSDAVDSATPFSGAIEDFLNAGEAPLLFVAASFAALPQWERESEAVARQLGKRAILLGARENSVSESVLRCQFAALNTLLPRVSAMIHAGGIGTLALGLRAATPMLLLPRAHDQFDNARRAARLGWAREFKGGNLAPQISALLSDEQLKNRLEKLRRDSKNGGFADGAARAADFLENAAIG